MISIVIGLVGLALVLIWEGRRKSESNAKEALAAKLNDKSAALEAEMSLRESESKRFETVIASKREELERLLNEINACGSPESVSSLAKRLLSNPW